MLRARVPAYLARRRADLNAIHGTLALDDFAQIEIIAHNLKGTGSSYGFPRITEIGGLLESAAKTGSRALISSLLKDLNTYLQSVDQSIASTDDCACAKHPSGPSGRNAMGTFSGENKTDESH